jgi:hypothetical protein
MQAKLYWATMPWILDFFEVSCFGNSRLTRLEMESSSAVNPAYTTANPGFYHCTEHLEASLFLALLADSLGQVV